MTCKANSPSIVGFVAECFTLVHQSVFFNMKIWMIFICITTNNYTSLQKILIVDNNVSTIQISIDSSKQMSLHVTQESVINTLIYM
jgi:hypothetical protein